MDRLRKLTKLGAIHLLLAGSLSAQKTLAQPAAVSVIAYQLESVDLTGSTRLTLDQVRDYLRINDRTMMTDDWIARSKATLMGLGIFKDVLFSLRKGSSPGLAKLSIKFEDDEDVVSDWAVGGEFGLALTEPTPTFGDDSVFRGYRLGLIARNILRESHRAAVLGDIDSRGNLVFGQIAYGLPRFVSESIQFDAALTIVDPSERYFETESFGLKAQSLWTRQRGGVDVVYGAAWYSNTNSRFRLKNWPEIVAGPKIGVMRETRFLGFMPSTGYRWSLAVIPSLLKSDESVLESEISGTWFAWNVLALTATGKATNTGTSWLSTRAEGRLEIPITASARGLRSLFYIAVRNGMDRAENTRLSGTETVAGFRYHSTGFIGDVSFRMVGEHPWSKKATGTVP